MNVLAVHITSSAQRLKSWLPDGPISGFPFAGGLTEGGTNPQQTNAMTDSIFALADRANSAYASRPGFVRCTVHNEQPPVLAFELSSAASAEEFMFELQVQGAQMRMEIASNRPDTVLQYR